MQMGPNGTPHKYREGGTPCPFYFWEKRDIIKKYWKKRKRRRLNRNCKPHFVIIPNSFDKWEVTSRE